MRDERTVYIAGPWADKPAAATAQRRFTEAGWTVVSRWIDHHGDGDNMPGQLRHQAEEDVKDIRQADVFVLLNTARSEGKATEMGMALAWGVPCIVVGDSESTNIFYNLPQIRRVRTVTDALWTAHQLLM